MRRCGHRSPYRIVQALRLQAKRGTLNALGKRSNVCLWSS
jgi:hypothetical protein